MKRLLFVFCAICILSFAGCHDSADSQESLNEISITARNVDFSKMKSKDIGRFLKKCLDNPNEMGLIKFEKQNLKQYNILNKDLERFLLEHSDTKDVYFYGDIFAVKSKNGSFNKSNPWNYYGNSDENVCSGTIFPAQNCETIDDTCRLSDAFVYATEVLGSFSGYHPTQTTQLHRWAIQYNYWSGDKCSDSEIAVNYSPTGAISRLN